MNTWRGGRGFRRRAHGCRPVFGFRFFGDGVVGGVAEVVAFLGKENHVRGMRVLLRRGDAVVVEVVGGDDFGNAFNGSEGVGDLLGDGSAVGVIEDVEEDRATLDDGADFSADDVKIFHVEEAGLLEDVGGVDAVIVGGEPVVGDHNKGGLSGEILFEFLPDEADLGIGGFNSGVGLGSAGTAEMLDMVDIDEVKERELGAVLLDDHVEDVGAHFIGDDAGVAGFVLRFAIRPDVLVGGFIEEFGRGVFVKDGVGGNIGNAPVERFGVARGGPANAGGAESGGFGEVVDGGDFDDLVLVVDGIGDEGDAFVGGTVVVVVAEDAVLFGIDAGDEGNVVGPRDSGGGGFHGVARARRR